MYRSSLKVLKTVNFFASNSLKNNAKKFSSTLSSAQQYNKFKILNQNVKAQSLTQVRFMSDDSDKLEKDFQSALANLQKVTVDVDNEQKLKLYALFKQGTNGPCNIEKPSVFNVVDKAKWQAWKALGDLSNEDAKKQYIAAVEELLKASGGSSSPVENKEPELIFEKKDHVYWIKLNRPRQCNALTQEMYDGIVDALKLAGEDQDIKFTVLTGTGEYYSSGNDLKNFMKAGAQFKGDIEKATQFARDSCQRFVSAFIDFPKPLIAAVNGPCYGIMFTTLGLVDVRIASDDALFTCPFSSLGISPEGCSTYTFPQAFGSSLASELLLLNYKMPVEEAHRLGFVSRIVPKDKLESYMNELLYGENGLVKTCYPNSMFNAKAIIRNEETRLMLHQVNKVECDLLKQSFTSEECMESLSKFYSRKQ